MSLVSSIAAKKVNIIAIYSLQNIKYLQILLKKRQKTPLHIHVSAVMYINIVKAYIIIKKKYGQRCELSDKSAPHDLESAPQQIVSTDNKIDANLIKELIQQNRELQSQLITLSNNKGDNITINNNGTQNTQNNKFNINVFLNEQCRNAINFTDFIDRIEVSHDDLENNAELGFVNGISKILMDNLKQLTLHERPIHCTDVKRETMYIKDDNQWQKDAVNEKLHSAIQEVSMKSIRSLMDWKQQNPDYDGAESEFSNKCVAIQQQSLAGDKKDVYYPKVLHKLAKENVIDKV